MSLYTDDDLGHLSDFEPKVEETTVPSDPIKALELALTLPAESAAQASALIAAGQRFEDHPEKLPVLCGQLLPMVEGGESLLRAWTLEMVDLAVGRSALKVEIKLAGELFGGVLDSIDMHASRSILD
jgi:symplekin